MIREFESYHVRSFSAEPQEDGSTLITVRVRAENSDCAQVFVLQYRMSGAMRFKATRQPWARHADGTVAGSTLAIELEGNLGMIEDKIFERFWWEDYTCGTQTES